jgi:hypothetical protein
MPSSRGDRRGLFICENAIDRATNHAMAAINPNSQMDSLVEHPLADSDFTSKLRERRVGISIRHPISDQPGT